MVLQAEINSLADAKQWDGGWYQPIQFPNGTRTFSLKYGDNFFNMESFGKKKWERIIRPYLPSGKLFTEIGCNAGLNLVLAREAGFEHVWGVEISSYFAKQCHFVLNAFGSRASLIVADAFDYDYAALPMMDVMVMSNALYWMGYSDEHGYAPDYQVRMKRFLERMFLKANRLVIIGRENIDRIGGKRELTCQALEPYFNVTVSDIVPLDGCPFNVIVAEPRSDAVLEVDTVIQELSGRRDKGRAAEFFKVYARFMEGYLEYRKFIANRIDQDGHYHTYHRTAFDIRRRMVEDINLICSLIIEGMKDNILIFKDAAGTEVDGYHRLAILKAVGEKEVKVSCGRRTGN